MFYAYNITFVILPDREDDFLDWLRQSALAMMFPAGYGVIHVPGVRKVIESGGEKPGSCDGLSIAVQADFDSEKDAHRWHDECLPPVIRSFNARFSPDCAFFTTLLEVTPCDSL